MSDDAREAAAAPAAEQTEAEGGGEELLSLVLAEHQRRAPPARIDGVVVGTLYAVGRSGEPRVDFPENASGDGVPARALCAVSAGDVGREVALLFEGGDPARPVLMGLMYQAAAAAEAPAAAEAGGLVEEARAHAAAEVTRDGERLVFEADKEIVLRCGKAQITLTRAGKILIKGAYLLTRSTGVNRIQGGSVQIN